MIQRVWTRYLYTDLLRLLFTCGDIMSIHSPKNEIHILGPQFVAVATTQV